MERVLNGWNWASLRNWSSSSFHIGRRDPTAVLSNEIRSAEDFGGYTGVGCCAQCGQFHPQQQLIARPLISDGAAPEPLLGLALKAPNRIDLHLAGSNCDAMALAHRARSLARVLRRSAFSVALAPMAVMARTYCANSSQTAFDNVVTSLTAPSTTDANRRFWMSSNLACRAASGRDASPVGQEEDHFDNGAPWCLMLTSSNTHRRTRAVQSRTQGRAGRHRKYAVST
ncbi:hypothetical protein [Pseudorhodoferax soli]|uniref:hypothetical protein n=1 Tax=Pseudorhodoferax soli TaxID=545864 RepID=UPI0011C069D6|nr:hypothetical protein [Pseudorhodoferax soli]